MPKKYATLYDFEDVGEVGLARKLESNSFKVDRGNLRILKVRYQPIGSSEFEAGYIDTFNGCFLCVLNIRKNPLERFVENYDIKNGKSSNKPIHMNDHKNPKARQ